MASRTIPTNGTAIRRARMLAGYGSTELAAKVGVTQGHLSSIENGRRDASPQLLRKLAKETEMTVRDFIDAAKIELTTNAA